MQELNQTMFVNAPSGLRVRDSSSIDGEIIGVLDNLTEVLAVKQERETITIDGVTGNWTFVSLNAIQGWVFGGFLTPQPVIRFPITFEGPTIGVYPVQIESQQGRSHFLVFSDGSRENLPSVINWDRHIGQIRIFNTTSKESEYRIFDFSGGGNFFKLNQFDNWLFAPDHGFVYIYDFPGNIIDRWGENEVLQRLPNARRYGPLLEINHNGRKIRFWSGGSETGVGIWLLEYFEEHDEILLWYTFWTISGFRIFNLQHERYTDLMFGRPHFNNSRDIAISVAVDDDGGMFITIFAIYNGEYTNVFNERINSRRVRENRWINDNEFRIEFTLFDEEDNVLLIRRNGADFELVFEKNE